MGGVLGSAQNLIFGGDGAQQQQNAANNANAELQSMFNTVNQNAQPYLQAGSQAVGQLQSNMSSLNQPFTMQQFQQSPGYQFSLQQGQQAVQNSSAAQGGLVSGAQMAALNNYSQNQANTEYQNAFNNYQTQQQNTYNRLAGVAQMGASSNAALGGQMMNTANQIGQNTIGASNAYAASQQQGMNNLGSMAGLGMAGYLALSDKRIKRNIRAISKEDLKELRKSIKPYVFNYANDVFGEGEWVGAMAQDLEKSKLGKTIVITGRDGLKRIDMKKLGSLILATMAEAA